MDTTNRAVLERRLFCIRAAYLHAFHQESVLCIDEPACVSF